MKSFVIALAASTFLASGAYAMGHSKAEHVMLDAGYKLADEQVLRYRVLDNLSVVDPTTAEGTDSSEVNRQQFEGLFYQDSAGNLKNALAVDVNVSDDQKTYTFTLRDDAKWSDGTKVTASDFVYSWRRVVDPEVASEYSYYIAMMQVKNAQKIVDGEVPKEELGVEALDDVTLKVTLENPLPYFTKMLVLPTTYPVPSWVIEEHGDQWTRPENIVVNGPFKLTENSLGEQYVVERNPMYWDNDNVILDKVIYKIINDENQAFTRFLAGELDYTEVPTGQWPRISAEYPDITYKPPRFCTYYANFNFRENGPDFFKDERVRKALWLSVDRDILVENVMQGGQTPAYSFTHHKTLDYTLPQIEWAEWTQEQRDALAVELMSDAGYGPDNPLEFNYVFNTSEGHRKIAIFLQQQWKQKLSVEMTISNMEWKTLLDVRSGGDFEMSRNAWCGDYNEPSTFVDLYHTNSTQNDSRYSNPIVDKLLDMSKTYPDPQPLYTMIEAFVQEEAGIIPLYYYTRPMLLREGVKGWPFDNVQQFWFAKDMYMVEPE